MSRIHISLLLVLSIRFHEALETNCPTLHSWNHFKTMDLPQQIRSRLLKHSRITFLLPLNAQMNVTTSTDSTDIKVAVATSSVYDSISFVYHEEDEQTSMLMDTRSSSSATRVFTRTAWATVGASLCAGCCHTKTAALAGTLLVLSSTVFAYKCTDIKVEITLPIGYRQFGSIVDTENGKLVHFQFQPRTVQQLMIETGHDCLIEEWINDGFCDDFTNTAGCNWDGGDCCGDNVSFIACSDCLCLQSSLDEDASSSVTTVVSTTSLFSGSCGFGLCGGVGSGGTSCYCDELCVSMGDCCSDYEEHCVDDVTGSTSLGIDGSCSGFCGTNSIDNSCFCDFECSYYGDCCEDFYLLCPSAAPQFTTKPASSSTKSTSLSTSITSILPTNVAVTTTDPSAEITPFLPAVCNHNLAERRLEDKYSRIVGGHEVMPPFKHKLLVSLQSFDYHFCGGSLFGDGTWVITAAHCVSGSSKPDVVLHRHNLMESLSTEGATKFRSYKVISHAQYDSSTMVNDIALIKLSSDDGEPLQASEVPENVRGMVVTLDDGTFSSTEGTVLTVAGWGDTTGDSDFPSSAQEVQIQYIAHDKCNSASWYEGELDASTMLCAGQPNGSPGKDSCQGDSGGPLFAQCQQTDGSVTQVLVGVVSWGYGCALENNPGVYTRVSTFRNWIESNMQSF